MYIWGHISYYIKSVLGFPVRAPEVSFSGCPKSPNDHGDENNNVDVYFDAMTIRPHDNWSNWQGCPGYYMDFAGSGLFLIIIMHIIWSQYDCDMIMI